MRRVLLLLLAATPALALGQSAGDLVLKTNDSSDLKTINRAQCAGTARNEEVDFTEDVTADLTWTTKPSGEAFTSGGVYRIYVSKSKPAAGQTKDSTVQIDCATDLNGAAINPIQVGGDLTVTDQTQTKTSLDLSAFVPSGLSCTAGTKVDFYVCVQQVSGSNTAVGYALKIVSLDTRVPPAPTDLRAEAGDGVLKVSCSKGSGDSDSNGHFKAKAVPQGGGAARFSGESSSCDGLKISGLANGQRYDVTAYRLDDSHNPSAASDALSGEEPIPTEDYWNHYDGREKGGCSTGAGGAGGAVAAGLLGALSLLAALRRRKS